MKYLGFEFDEKPIVIQKAKTLIPASEFEKWVYKKTKLPPPLIRGFLVLVAFIFFIFSLMFFGKFYYLITVPQYELTS